ncbi:hypothetical protein JCM8097_009262 [Rhodosporidiobolus ruineniae]
MVHLYALAAAAAALASVATAAPAASSCTVGGYYDPVSASCKPCGGHAKTCKNPRIALTCNRGYYLSRGTCLAAASCPSGTFGSNSGSTAGTCAACYNSTFKTCTGTGSTAATSCVNNYCLGGGRCKPLSLIPNTQYCSKGEIVNCPNGAKTCAADGSALTCDSTHYLNPSTNSCVLTCPETVTYENGVLHPAVFANNKTMTCTPCSNPSAFSCTVDADGVDHVRYCYMSQRFNGTCGTAAECAAYGKALVGYNGDPFRSYTWNSQNGTSDIPLPEYFGYLGGCGIAK